MSSSFVVRGLLAKIRAGEAISFFGEGFVTGGANAAEKAGLGRGLDGLETSLALEGEIGFVKTDERGIAEPANEVVEGGWKMEGKIC